jgi:glycosyltransferase involved in cell wall biosynthesis
MKILFITQHYMPIIGGLEIYIKEVADLLIKQGHDIHVISSLSDKNKQNESFKGVKIHRLKPKKFLFHRFTSFDCLEDKIKEINPDVIQFFSHGHFFFYQASKIAKKSGIPYFVLSFGPIIVKETATFKSFFQDWLFDEFFTPFIYSNSESVFYRIPYTEQWCVSKGSLNNIYLPSGITKDFFVKSNYSLKNKLFKQKKVILFVGRVCKDKGVDVLVESFVRVSKKIPDAQLVLFGRRDEQFVKNLKLNNDIHLMGPIPFGNEKELVKIIDMADVFVLPSKHEGFGQVLAQAMARGKPIVATKVGAVPSWVSSKNGFLVDYGDVDALSDNIIKLLENKELSENIGNYNKKYAKNYLLDNQINIIEKEYKKCKKK